MLKHVHISPLRNRSADSISLKSSSSSLCGSPEPPSDSQQINAMSPSRSSSYTSLNESIAQTTLKVYTGCLKQDIEYKTLAVSWDTTARQIVSQVLRRCKIRHRDPRLFFLSMEVRIRRADARTMLILDDSARPAMLQACHPQGESKFHLQVKTGGLVRVHTTALQQTSQYKSLMISEQTTSDELLALLLSCYNLNEPVEDFSLYEVCPDQEYQRKLHPDDLPLRAQFQRNQKGDNCHFLVRRIRNLSRPCARSLQLNEQQSNSQKEVENNNCENVKSTPPAATTTTIIESSTPSSRVKSTFIRLENCFAKKLNSFRFDNSNTSQQDLNGNFISKSNQSTVTSVNSSSSSYNPVYNIREIRTSQHSFSSFGNDKQLIDLDASATPTATTTNSNLNFISRRHSVAVDEIVNAHPVRRVGNFVYV